MCARLIAFAVLAIILACSRGADTLPALSIDIDRTSVSGVSSGAYMAGQLHVAHSEQIVGSGIVAGGPYGCAERKTSSLLHSTPGKFRQGFKNCLNGKGIPNPTVLAKRAKDLAKNGQVDPLTNLREDRVYLFSGGKDGFVKSSVVKAAELFYIYAGVPTENIALITRSDAGHSFLTSNTGNPCGVSARPFVSDCDYDQAGAILKWIYGDLNSSAQHATGNFLVFDQSPFAEGVGNGLSNQGVVYIPQTCAHKGRCRLHIALHGCQQNRDQVGMTFVEGSGFARWADTNRLVILFPQVGASTVNPKGCWDWWGYTGKNFITKDAPQISAIWRMVQQLARGDTATNW